MSSHHRRRKREAFCYNTWLKRSQGLPLSLALMCCPDLLTSLLQGQCAGPGRVRIHNTTCKSQTECRCFPASIELYVSPALKETPK
ncbi:hypothetical protein CY34DRAFT_700806 [Suillus luteus UH-Slu-Lm8-n1]|uniref:Uncharacterized protein n=1 Tax=Suillus luteus UH-Slu-Lm8-n1 TaxID=930992 RepID=A0A0D0A5S5_9AGAM|nr:hypothetical protein CY34DRAFT_700806 [Suillus luteus UH-Slu-Lm8-n1]